MKDILKVYRHEKKYILSWYEFQNLNNKLSHILKRDPYCPKEGYEVKSLYFDNPYDFALFQKLEGTDLRHKYRIRVYNNNFSRLKLEKKSKHNIMTNKESALIGKEEAEKIVKGEVDFLENSKEELLKTFYYKVKHEQYTPKVIVKYRRIAYVYPVSNLRITFDFKIKKSNQVKKFFTDKNDYFDAYEKDAVVMEVKFDNFLPTFIRTAISFPNLMLTSSSKYVASRFAQ